MQDWDVNSDLADSGIYSFCCTVPGNANLESPELKDVMSKAQIHVRQCGHLGLISPLLYSRTNVILFPLPPLHPERLYGIAAATL